MFGPGQFDESAARKSFQSMSEAQAAMFELQLDARKKIDAVLTKDQRDKLARYWSNR
jgi:Spy/CpxP family protein refolding chaperone